VLLAFKASWLMAVVFWMIVDPLIGPGTGHRSQ
jgi:hypothetical protein